MASVVLDPSNTKITPNQYGIRSYWGTEATYNGSHVLIIPKSYIDRGFVAGNTQYYNPAFLTPEVTDYLKPVEVDAQFYEPLVQFLDKTDFGSYPNQIEGYQPPDYSEGAYIISADAPGFNVASGAALGNKGLYSARLGAHGVSPITGISDINGTLSYVGNQAPGTTSSLTTYSPTGYTYQYVDPARSRGGFWGIIDSVNSIVSDLGPIALAANFIVPGLGTALYAGNQISKGNWGNAVLSLAMANVPNAEGVSTSGFEGTILDVPSIGQATDAIKTTLGVSQGAASAIMSGVISAVASGGDLEQALKTVAASYVGYQAGEYVGDLMKAEGFKDLAKITSSVTNSSTKAWLLNQDIAAAAKSGFISSAVPIALKEVPGWSGLSDAQKNTFTRIATVAAMNPNADLGSIIKNTGINVAVDSVLSSNSDYKALPTFYQDLVRNSVASAAQGKPLDQALSNFITTEAQRQLKDYGSKKEYLNQAVPTAAELKDKSASAVQDMEFALEQKGLTGFKSDNYLYGDEYQQLVKAILGPDAPPVSFWTSSPWGQMTKDAGIKSNMSDEEAATRLYQYQQTLDNRTTTADEATAYFNAMLGRDPTAKELSQMTSQDEQASKNLIDKYGSLQERIKTEVGRDPTIDELDAAVLRSWNPDAVDWYINNLASLYVTPDEFAKSFMDTMGRAPTQAELEKLLAVSNADQFPDAHLKDNITAYKKATDAGFPDTDSYSQYKGDLGAYRAAQAGFPDFATYAVFGGDINEYKATQAGFPNYQTQQQYGGNYAAYNADVEAAAAAKAQAEAQAKAQAEAQAEAQRQAEAEAQRQAEAQAEAARQAAQAEAAAKAQAEAAAAAKAQQPVEQVPAQPAPVEQVPPEDGGLKSLTDTTTQPTDQTAGLPSVVPGQTQQSTIVDNGDGTFTRTMPDGSKIIEDEFGTPIETKTATQVMAETDTGTTDTGTTEKTQDQMTAEDWAKLYATPTTNPDTGETIKGVDLADYSPQDFGADPNQNWDSFQETLKEIVDNGGYTSQWKENADGTHTLTSDDGSTLTVNVDGNITGVTEATDTPYKPDTTKTTTGSGTTTDTTGAGTTSTGTTGTTGNTGANVTPTPTPTAGLDNLYKTLIGAGALTALSSSGGSSTPNQFFERKPLQMDWNQAEINAPVGGIAYGQQYLNPQFTEVQAAQGGLMSLAGGGHLGGYSDGGRLLRGPGDGMSDSIPASIAQKQPARLADGEFVIPADVVSHLGNGSTDAGSRVLYEMMNRVRKARTGNPKQGKQINPSKFIPK